MHASTNSLTDTHIRNAEPTEYQRVISVLNEWWGGRHMADMLPKLFFVHFHETTFVTEHGGELVGFVAGFVSQTFKSEAYIHFVGVHPEFRQKGLGRALYERFFEAAKECGCDLVRCVTSPVNKGSVSFHLGMGFSLEPGSKTVEELPVAKNYDRHGGDRVVFCKKLGS